MIERTIASITGRGSIQWAPEEDCWNVWAKEQSHVELDPPPFKWGWQDEMSAPIHIKESFNARGTEDERDDISDSSSVCSSSS